MKEVESAMTDGEVVKFSVQSDIDPEATFSADAVEKLVNKVTIKLGLHTRTINLESAALLEEIYEIVQGTHVSIRLLLSSKRHHTAIPVGDALSLARDQVEATFVAIHLMCAPEVATRHLLKCSMLKLAHEVGLEQGQHGNLERWTVRRNEMVKGLELMASAMNCTLKEVRKAFNEGLKGNGAFALPQIKPLKLLQEIGDPSVKEAMERLYQEYRHLSNFTHLHFDKLVAHQKQADIQVGDLRAFEFYKRHESQALVCSMAAVATTAAAHLKILGGDVELRLAIAELWELLSKVSMLGIALWDTLGSQSGIPLVLESSGTQLEPC